MTKMILLMVEVVAILSLESFDIFRMLLMVDNFFVAEVLFSGYWPVSAPPVA